MKVAICFFGLTRSLDKTIQSIRRNIFEPFANNSYSIHTYLHTFNLAEITNPRSGEKGCKLNATEYKLLEPFEAYQIDDQNKIDKQLHFGLYRSKGGPWKDGFKSLNNLLRQLYSLEQVTNLWKERASEYNYVVYCRPDVQFTKMFDIKQLSSLTSDRLILPSFSWCKGLNDRFAVGQPDVMLIYGMRRKYALEYSKSNPLHAERFLKYVMDRFNVKPNPIDFMFLRIRANGKVSILDNKLLNRQTPKPAPGQTRKPAPGQPPKPAPGQTPKPAPGQTPKPAHRQRLQIRKKTTR